MRCKKCGKKEDMYKGSNCSECRCKSRMNYYINGNYEFFIDHGDHITSHLLDKDDIDYIKSQWKLDTRPKGMNEKMRIYIQDKYGGRVFSCFW